MARAGEPDWFEAMARPLQQIQALAVANECPILCAGDVFHKWNSSAELINFALTSLPNDMIVIPGQHDLPYHNLEDIDKSAFWTLTLAGKYKVLFETNTCIPINSISSCIGFPFGVPVDVIRRSKQKEELAIGMVHEYTWIKGKSFPDAPAEGNAATKPDWQGYDIMITGDNHIPFLIRCGKCLIYNPGSLMRRNSDQLNHEPEVGLIWSTGEIQQIKLNISEDVFDQTAADEVTPENPKLKEFLDGLLSLQDVTLDFVTTVLQTIKKRRPSKMVQEMLLKAMEQGEQ